MALITILREKMGRLLVVIIGLAIMMFVLTDLFVGGGSSFLGPDNDIGEISGETISFDEFQAQVDQLSANFNFNVGRNPSDKELLTLREQAWELLIVKHAFENEYQKIGLSVHDEEVVDMVQGKNISRELMQAFTNPETNEFDRNNLIAYLQNIQNAPTQQQVGWYLFENDLRPGRLRIKFDNLLIKTNYVTDAEAENEYKSQNRVAEIKYLYIPFYSVPDSLVSVTDAQLQEYVDDHSKEFQSDNMRSLEYVKFPITASVEDSAAIMDEMNKVRGEFENVANDSVFARINSDAANFFSNYNLSSLPPFLGDQINDLQVRDILGPELQEGSFKLYKISRIVEDTIYRARARHIIIKWDDESSEAKDIARTKANDILRQIQNGADFAELAQENGQDQSAAFGGDLGWGEQGSQWVEEFETPVFQATTRLLVKP